MALRAFGSFNYFNYLLRGSNCGKTGDNVYSCGHVLMSCHLCASLLNIYLHTSPNSINLQVQGEKLTVNPLLDWILRFLDICWISLSSAWLELKVLLSNSFYGQNASAHVNVQDLKRSTGAVDLVDVFNLYSVKQMSSDTNAGWEDWFFFTPQLNK